MLGFLRLQEAKLLRNNKSGVVLCILLCGAFLGCGPGNSIARVEGVVTLDDKPLADIRINFQPENRSDDGAIGSFGLTDASGKFALQTSDTKALGAAVGRHRIILADKLTEDAEDSDAGFRKGPKSRIPARYAKEELHFEVKPGVTNQADLKLLSK